jgi:polyisoprenoid-binding protein YceI
MKKTLFILALLLMTVATTTFAQGKYSTKTGTVKFVAESALNDAKAENHQVRVIYDPATQDIAFSLLIKSFEFEKALMQTHFNADMESETYPKATFAGKVTAASKIDLAKDGSYAITVDGDLTIHGKTKKVQEKGNLIVKGGKVQITGKFFILCPDYGVSPRSGVEKKVEISVDATLDPA